jgi:general stress protein 26
MMAGRLGIDDVEDLSAARAKRDALDELVTRATECTFVFTDETGWPRGVTMTYMYDGEDYWLTAVRGRRQVDCVEKDDRVSLVISSAGTGLRRLMVSMRGRAEVLDDRETMDWFLAEFTKRIAGDPSAFIRLLDSENRVVLKFTPIGRPTSHDSQHLPGDGRGGTGPARPANAAPDGA